MSEQPAEKDKEYSSGGWSAHFVLIVCVLLYMINYMDRQVFSVILQPMKLDLGLTDAQCGLASTVFTVGMAFFSFPISYMVDRWSRKKSMGIMAILWSGFTFATGLAKNFVGVILPRAFVGLGEAGFAPGGVAMVSASYPERSRGRALGIFTIAIPLGAALGVMLGGLISSKMGWRAPFYYFAIPGVVLGILAFFMKDYKTVAIPGASAGLKGFGRAFVEVGRAPTVRWFWPALGLTVFMGQAVLVWLPTLAMRMLNVNEAGAGLIVGGIGLSAIIGAPLGGFLADLWQKRDPRGRMYVVALANIISVVLIIAVVLLRLNTLGIILGVFYGIFQSMTIPAYAAVTQDIAPVRHKGLSYGLCIFTQYMFGGAWAPWIMGGVSDLLGGGADGLGYAIMLSSAVGLIGGIFFLLASRTYPSDAEKFKGEAVMAD
jgi:MFS family permease